jgi:hypothetical protein
LWTGTGSGNSWDSIYNAADDGTNFSTYGGLSRTTYTTLNGYYLASAGALTLAKMATAYDAVQLVMTLQTLSLQQRLYGQHMNLCTAYC